MQSLTRIGLEHRALASCLLLAVTLGLAAGLPRLRTEFGSRVLVGDQHPAIRTLDAFLARYGGGVPLYVAWACGPDRPCASVFDESSLRMAQRVTDALAARPGISQVRSPANAPVFVPASDGFAIRRLVEHGEVAPDREHLARLATADRSWVGTLISADARVGAIVVQTSASDSRTDTQVVAAVQEAIAPFEAFGFALVGEAFGNVLGGRELAESTGRLVPIMVGVIALVILAQTRSWQAVFACLLCLGAALAWTFGAMGFFGWPRDSILEILAPLVLIVGVCDSIHFFSAYAEDADGAAPWPRRRRALVRAAGRVARPCVLTSATTGAAFLSFATSDLDTFERFGVAASFGVLACLVLTFGLLPLLLGALPAHAASAARTSRTWHLLLESILRTASQRAVPILGVSAFVVLASAASWAAFLRVDTSRQELFGENSRILAWVRFVEENLRPSFGIEIDLELPPKAAIEDPATLGRISRLARALEREPRVGSARSLLDPLGRVKSLVYAGRNGDGAFGSSFDANAELLEILQLEDPDLLGAWLSFDRRHTRISVDVPEQNHAAAAALLRNVREHVAARLPGWRTTLTGTAPLGVEWVNDVQRTQQRSFPTALLLVWVLVASFLRSPVLGLAALVPALVPVVVVLGAMGLAGLPLDVGRAMIAAVVIGIAVDDGIHLLHRYGRLRGRGTAPDEAMSAALLETGRPIVTTSVALALGFMTLTASAWGTVSGFGFFVSLSIALALLATLFLLPALVFARSGRSRRDRAG